MKRASFAFIKQGWGLSLRIAGIGIPMLAVGALMIVGSGCGNDHNSSAPVTTPASISTPTPTATPTPSPTPTPYPPPFDTSAGEGDLLSSELVTTYNTDPGPAGLDTFYSDLICNGLDTAQCTTNTDNLDTPEFGNFDLAKDPIANNPLGIKTIDAVKIDYTAINVDKSALPVSGGILIPQIPSGGSIKGIVLYFHGTTVQRSAVPSNFTSTSNVSTYTDSIVLAAIWASQGYVVVMPDYIGLGDDTTHPHPYVVYPSENAQTGLAMLKAARTLLSKSYGISGLLPLYISGYSEGGAYSLQAGHMMQDNPLYASVLDVNLRKVVPLSGFFDLSGTGLPYLFDNISASHNDWYSLNPTESAISKPYLSAYLVVSFAHYSGISADDILASSFNNCPTSSTDCGASNDLYGLYFTAPQGSDYNAKVAFLAYGLATLTGWSVSKNDITPLLTPAYAKALMEGDSSNPLYAKVVQSDTYPFVPDFPVTLVSLRHDSVVTRKNTDVAFSYFIGHNPTGPYKEDLVPNSDFLVMSSLADYFTAPSASVGEVDHLTELPFLSVLILNEFNTAP